MNAPTNMPVAPYSYKKHTVAFRECRRFGEDESIRVLSTHNPIRPNARAWNLFEYVLRPLGKTMTTIGDVLDRAEAIGYFRPAAAQHLRWIYTWGDYIEVNGERHFREIPEPLPEMVEQAIPSDRKRFQANDRKTRKSRRS